MADVFISFIHEEKEVATAVQRFLRAALNTTVFISSDEWQVFAGENWLDRISSELSTAKVVILMLSKRSAERPWVNFEAGAAWLTGKVIIPACYCGLSKDTLPKPYSSLQALDLPIDDYYLVCSVAHHLSMPSPPPLRNPELNGLKDAIKNLSLCEE